MGEGEAAAARLILGMLLPDLGSGTAASERLLCAANGGRHP